MTKGLVTVHRWRRRWWSRITPSWRPTQRWSTQTAPSWSTTRPSTTFAAGTDYQSSLQMSSLLNFLVFTENQSPNFKLSRSPGIDSRESIPSAYVAWARICISFKETRHRFSAWRAGTKPYLSYWPARLHRLAKSIPRYRFLGSINVYKYGPWPAVTTTLFQLGSLRFFLFKNSSTERSIGYFYFPFKRWQIYVRGTIKQWGSQSSLVLTQRILSRPNTPPPLPVTSVSWLHTAPFLIPVNVWYDNMLCCFFWVLSVVCP